MGKIYKVKTENYTVISNTILQDESLSWKARGVFAYLYAQHNDWEFYETEVMKHATDGRDSLRSALKELTKHGYLIRKRNRDEQGRVRSSDWLISDEPIKKPMLGKPTQAKPMQENTTLTSTNKTSTNRTSTNNNNKQPKAVSASELETRFNSLWKLYPKKEGKAGAFKAYKKAVKEGVTDETIKTGIQNYVQQRAGQDPKYTKQGSTWFNGKHWQDEYTTNNSGSSQDLNKVYGNWDF